MFSRTFDYGMKILFYGGSDFQEFSCSNSWVLSSLPDILHPSNHNSLLFNTVALEVTCPVIVVAPVNCHRSIVNA